MPRLRCAIARTTNRDNNQPVVQSASELYSLVRLSRTSCSEVSRRPITASALWRCACTAISERGQLAPMNKIARNIRPLWRGLLGLAPPRPRGATHTLWVPQTCAGTQETLARSCAVCHRRTPHRERSWNAGFSTCWVKRPSHPHECASGISCFSPLRRAVLTADMCAVRMPRACGPILTNSKRELTHVASASSRIVHRVLGKLGLRASSKHFRDEGGLQKCLLVPILGHPINGTSSPVLVSTCDRSRLACPVECPSLVSPPPRRTRSRHWKRVHHPGRLGRTARAPAQNRRRPTPQGAHATMVATPRAPHRSSLPPQGAVRSQQAPIHAVAIIELGASQAEHMRRSLACTSPETNAPGLAL